MNKSRKIIATILNFVLVCFIALSIALLVPACNKVPTENNNNSHTEHSYVYTKVDDDNHKKTCSGCTEVDETEKHSYDNEQDTTCNNCDYVRELAGSESKPTVAKISIDKPNLVAGDTFTLTLEVETSREDYNWSSISLDISPLLDAVTVDAEIAKNFELVSTSTMFGTAKLNPRSWINNNCDLFNSEIGTGSFRVSLAYVGTTPVKTSKNLIVTAQIKVKETAPTISTFDFGVALTKHNVIGYESEGVMYYDYADGSTQINREDPTTSSDTGLSINKIALSITAKAN